MHLSRSQLSPSRVIGSVKTHCAVHYQQSIPVTDTTITTTQLTTSFKSNFQVILLTWTLPSWQMPLQEAASGGLYCMLLHKPHCPAHHSLIICSGLQLPEVALAEMFLLCQCRGISPHHHSGLWGAVEGNVVSDC